MKILSATLIVCLTLSTGYQISTSYQNCEVCLNDFFHQNQRYEAHNVELNQFMKQHFDLEQDWKSIQHGVLCIKKGQCLAFVFNWVKVICLIAALVLYQKQSVVVFYAVANTISLDEHRIYITSLIDIFLLVLTLATALIDIGEIQYYLLKANRRLKPRNKSGRYIN